MRAHYIILNVLQVLTEHDIDYIESNLYIYYETNHIFYLVWMIYIGYTNTQQTLAIINAKNGEISTVYHSTVSYHLQYIERVPYYHAYTTYYGNHSMMISSDGWIYAFSDKEADFIKFGESLAIQEAYTDLVRECNDYYVNGYNDWKSIDDALITNYKTETLTDLSVIYTTAFHTLNSKYNWSMNELFKMISLTNLYYWSVDTTLNEGLCDDLYGNDIRETERMKNELYSAFNDVGIHCIVSPSEISSDIENIESNIEYIISGDEGTFQYFMFNIDIDINAAQYIVIRLESRYDTNGKGDADLYISRDVIPNDNAYECRSNSIGNNEECILWPILNDNHVYYVMIYAFDDVVLKWNIFSDIDMQLTEITMNVPFTMRSNELEYFYVVLSEFDYKIGSYLCLYGLSENAVGYFISSTDNDCTAIVHTKDGTYYIQIETDASYNETEEFVVRLEYKHIYEIRIDQVIVITSNDFDEKYLYFTLSSLDDVKYLKLSINANVSILNNGAINLYNSDGFILCSISRFTLNECLLNIEYLYIGAYYIKYYGFIETEIIIQIIHQISWNIVPHSSLYTLPHSSFSSMALHHVMYLFDDESQYIYKWNWMRNEWDKNVIFNAPIWSSIRSSSQSIYTIATGNRYLYIFVSFGEIYKFDVKHNTFIQNDIQITDPHYTYLCIASDENDIYFIGNHGHPFIIYNIITKKWIFASNIENLNHDEAILCSVSSYLNTTMLLTFIPKQQQIWSYTKQSDLWYLFPQTLTMHNIQQILNIQSNILYLFGDLNHVQSIHILDINCIEYYNETDLNIMDSDDEIVFAIDSDHIKDRKAFIVWSKYGIQTTQNINNTRVIVDKDANMNIDGNNTFLYDLSTSAMLGCTYILIAIILISCQRKAMLQRKEIQRQKTRKSKDIESLTDL